MARLPRWSLSLPAPLLAAVESRFNRLSAVPLHIVFISEDDGFAPSSEQTRLRGNCSPDHLSKAFALR